MMEKLVRVGGGGCTSTPFLSLYLPSRTKLQCMLQLRGQIHYPFFHLSPYVLCGSIDRPHLFSLYTVCTQILWCKHDAVYCMLTCMPYIGWKMMIRNRLQVLYLVQAAGIRSGLQLSIPFSSSQCCPSLHASITEQIMAKPEPSPPAKMIKMRSGSTF